MSGFVKGGGRGASTDPSKYKIVNMKDHPELFKVVDDKDEHSYTL